MSARTDPNFVKEHSDNYAENWKFAIRLMDKMEATKCGPNGFRCDEHWCPNHREVMETAK